MLDVTTIFLGNNRMGVDILFNKIMKKCILRILRYMKLIANLRKDYFFLEITENKLFVVDNIIS